MGASSGGWNDKLPSSAEEGMFEPQARTGVVSFVERWLHESYCVILLFRLPIVQPMSPPRRPLRVCVPSYKKAGEFVVNVTALPNR